MACCGMYLALTLISMRRYFVERDTKLIHSQSWKKCDLLSDELYK